MNLLRHGVGSLVIFSILVLFFVNIYAGLDSTYTFTDKYELYVDSGSELYNLTESTNIMKQFEDMMLIQSVNQLQDGILQLTAGPSSIGDILGGLTAAGIGFTKILVSLVVTPFSILSIIVQFYGGSIIPGYIISGLATLVAVYVFFILLSAYLRSDI